MYGDRDGMENDVEVNKISEVLRSLQVDIL